MDDGLWRVDGGARWIEGLEPDVSCVDPTEVWVVASDSAERPLSRRREDGDEPDRPTRETDPEDEREADDRIQQRELAVGARQEDRAHEREMDREGSDLGRGLIRVVLSQSGNLGGALRGST